MGIGKFARRRGQISGDLRRRTAALPVTRGKLPERKFVGGRTGTPLPKRGVIDSNGQERGIRYCPLSRAFDEPRAAPIGLDRCSRRGNIEQMSGTLRVVRRTGLRGEWRAQ